MWVGTHVLDMGYDDKAIRETNRGFKFNIDNLDNLGVVERNGVRLVYNRMDGHLEVDRMDPTVESIIEDLERLQGNE